MAARLDEKFQQLKSRLESVSVAPSPVITTTPPRTGGGGTGAEPYRLFPGEPDGDTIRTPLDTSLLSRNGAAAGVGPSLSPPTTSGAVQPEASFGSVPGTLNDYVQALEESRRELMRMRQVRSAER